MVTKEKETLPEAKEITVKIELSDAKEFLKYLPSNLERARNEIEKGIENSEFWNFLKNCEYLESTRADFHPMGLMNPAWHIYCKHPCKHPENKDGPERSCITGLSAEVKSRITGSCERENCPIYKR